jgi:uncharacterized protein YkwD
MRFAVLFMIPLLAACGKASNAPISAEAPAGSALAPAVLAQPAHPSRGDSDPQASVPVAQPEPAPAPIPNPPPPSPPLTAVQQAISVANEVRRKNGLLEFRIDAKLSAVAQAHAEDMLKRHYFEHNTPEGLTPFQRMDQAGLEYNAAAENIAMGVNDPRKVFDLWLSSPGHRHNLLNKVYGRHGIGFAGGYWVHDFAD